MHEDIIAKLHWDDSTTSTEIVNLISKRTISDLEFLLQPINKEYWEKAAEVICELGVDRYSTVLPGMLDWLKDLNWPGAKCIFDELALTKNELIIRNVKDAFRIAYVSEDEDWMLFLKMLIDEIGYELFNFDDKYSEILGNID